MRRRRFMLAALLAPLLAGAMPGAPARAADVTTYDQAAFVAAEAAGKPILVAIHARWCSVCSKQRPILSELEQEPAYKNLVVFKVDFYDQKNVVAAMGAQSTAQTGTVQQIIAPIVGQVCDGFIGDDASDQLRVSLQPIMDGQETFVIYRGALAAEQKKQDPGFKDLPYIGRPGVQIYSSDGSLMVKSPTGKSTYYFFIKQGPNGYYLYGKQWSDKGNPVFSLPCHDAALAEK